MRDPPPPPRDAVGGSLFWLPNSLSQTDSPNEYVNPMSNAVYPASGEVNSASGDVMHRQVQGSVPEVRDIKQSRREGKETAPIRCFECSRFYL